MNDLHRVFYHELGHFIAHELNSKLNKGGETKSIVIKPYVPGSELYVGEAKINRTGNENEKYIPSKEELPYYLASSTYGCILQAYYLNESLRESQNKNGEDDLKKWYGSLMHHGLQDFNADIHEADIQYFEGLRQGKEFDRLMDLNPDNYLFRTLKNMELI